MQEKRCANDNHGRAVVTVRCCPNCGGIVNTRLPIRRCPQQEHAQARRTRHTFCVNCGERLIGGAADEPRFEHPGHEHAVAEAEPDPVDS